jgi:hypothetical protein
LATTPPPTHFRQLLGMNSNKPGLIKSIHGGGGKGTAHLDDPSCPDTVAASINKVSLCLSVYLSIYLSIYLAIYLI